ncbi:cytoskeleton-associated protein 4 [Hippocampus comes]|uniref:Cytoskeleton associated protein 4 n=1 Tax=Hippocampus comes TaxID=109280 RepID=A0A3Q2XYU9_HIPCM|nr:PREDICTED: cytoskeleton-associated protein 4 [Hippocampus comes]
MTAKNRQKSNAGEKATAASAAAPVHKEEKSQKSNGVSGSSGAQGSARSSGKKSRSCLGTLLSMLFYAAMIGGVALAAFHMQKVVEEIRQTSAKNAESAQISAEIGGKMEGVVQQVASLKGVVDSLKSSLGATRVELEGAVTRMARGEEETRRVDEALQKLQKDLLRELSEGISEVKDARERDFSSLEVTVEQRLEEVSRSVRASVTEFTNAQGQAQSQLADLQARLGGIEDPAMVKQELSSIVEVVAEIRAAKQDADASADSIREQINSVREELRTRSQEVASLSLEVESFRSVVQDTVGSLKLSVSATESQVQALGDRTGSVEGGLERAAEGVRDVETKVNEVAAQSQKRADDLEARLKASEESSDSVSAKMESLLSQYDIQESALAGNALSKVELEALTKQIEELEANVAVVGDAQDTLAATDSLMAQRVEELERLAAEGHAAKLEEQQQAIISLQTALGEVTQSLAALSEAQE